MLMWKNAALILAGITFYFSEGFLWADQLKTGGNTAFLSKHDFRVSVGNGVPEILMDGTPIRKRMFWGDGNKGGHVWLSPEWTEIQFDFVSPETIEAWMHFRFGENNGQAWIDKLEIKDLDRDLIIKNGRFHGTREELENEWTFWCAEIGKVKQPLSFEDDSLHIDMREKNLMRGFHVLLKNINLTRGHRYRVIIRAKADRKRIFCPGVYSRPTPIRLLGGLPPTIGSQVKLAAAEGVDLISFTVNGIWLTPGERPNYSEVDQVCRYILSENPNAQLLPRIRLNPPTWWVKSHPDQMMQFDDGETGSMPSIASEEYRRDAADALRRLIRYCEENYGANMAGYLPEGGNTGEWFYFDTWKCHLNGYDPATRTAWRSWLRKKYGSDQALSSAWRQNDAAIDSVDVPSAEKRRGSGVENFRTPRLDCSVLDFAFFQNEAMADMVIFLANVIREEVGLRRLCMVFYGYTFEFASVGQGPAISGHYALRRVLESPAVDIICGPTSYRDRQPGGGTSSMTAAESIALAGKISLREDDTSTCIAHEAGNRKPGWNNGAETLEESILLLRRNLGAEACRNLGSWWMDLEGLGWFDDARFWNEMEAYRNMEKVLLQNPAPFHPEIAAVVDEKSMCYLLSSGLSSKTTNPLITEGRAFLNRVGAPYGQYLLDDVVAGKTDAKLNVFWGVFALAREQRVALRARSERHAAIWCWAPGYIDLDKGDFSTDAVRELTGFNVELVKNGNLEVRATPAGIAVGLPAVFGDNTMISPVLSPNPGPGDVVWANYADGKPAIVLRPGKAPSLFCGTTTVPTVLYRKMADLAGVHLYTRQDANVYANGRYLAICATTDGKLKINVGVSGRIWNELESCYQGCGPTLELNFKKGETKVLRLPLK